MFKTIRAGGLAAAAAFLCANTSAWAQDATAPPQGSLHDRAAAALPVAPIDTAAPTIVPAPAAPAPILPALILPAIADHGTADAALTPLRTRPDRQVEATPVSPLAPSPAAGSTGVAHAGRNLEDLVFRHAGAEISDQQFACLASAVYFESRGEPLEGQLAVAEVILNRVRSGRFRDSICSVVTQPSQFSFVRRGVIPDAPRHSAAWQRAVAIAHIALNDLHDVTGEESLFFHATYVNPRWGRPRIARIGNHIFYR